MQPFAYSIPDYSGTEIYPTLDAVVKDYSQYPAYRALDITIVAHFADGTSKDVGLREYLGEQEVNVAEVEAYIDNLRETARKRDQEDDDKQRAEGRAPIMVTGICPIYMIPREKMIEQEVNLRKYVWKNA